jgi:hypothetical protein
MSESPLEGRRGDTWYWLFELTLEDMETPRDITGAQFRFTVKEDTTDPDDEASVVGTTADGRCQVIDGPGGKVTVKIPPAATDVAPGHYLYDLQARDGAGDVWTPMYGALVVLPDVSRTSP